MQKAHASRTSRQIPGVGMVAFVLGLAGVVVVAQQIGPSLFPPSPPSRPAAQAFEILDSFGPVDPEYGGGSPDVSVAAGWDRLVVVRNAAIEIVQKPFAAEPARIIAKEQMRVFLASVMRPDANRFTDPAVIFDQESGRFILVNATNGRCPAIGQCLSFIQLAVSKTPYPLTLGSTDWYFYEIDRTLERVDGGATFTASQADFDHIAVVGDRLIIGWQSFSWVDNKAIHPTGSGGPGQGGRIRVLDKRPLLQGQNVETWTDFRVSVSPQGGSNDRPRPAIMYDARDQSTYRDRVFVPIYSSCRGDPNPTFSWIVGAITGLESTPRLDVRTVPTPYACDFATQTALQPDGPTFNINVNGARPVFRDGRLWVTETTNHNFGSGKGRAIRWIEFDVRDWPNVRIVQSGLFGEPGQWHQAEAYSVDSMGNFVLTYMSSGTSLFLTPFITGRLATDPPGTLRQASRIREPGLVFDNGSGRGPADYQWVTNDPVDGSVWAAVIIPTRRSGSQGKDASDVWLVRLRPLDALTGSKSVRLP